MAQLFQLSKNFIFKSVYFLAIHKSFGLFCVLQALILPNLTDGTIKITFGGILGDPGATPNVLEHSVAEIQQHQARKRRPITAEYSFHSATRGKRPEENCET